MSSREPLGIAIGTAMAIALLWAAGQPSTAAIFHGVWHDIAHLATFALFGAIWSVALPDVPALAIAAGVAAFGFIHEACEILGHVHRFELDDAVLDALGGTIGTSWIRFRA